VASWAKAIATLGSDKDLLQLSKALAQAAKSNIALGFRSETDPYGKQWEERANGDTSRSLLVKTGRLKRSWNQQVRPYGFKIRSAVDYAKHHQFGTKRGLPARRMVPSPGDLPREWAAEFNAMARKWQKRTMNRVKRKFR
jgi:phage gpG-like protein